MIFYVMGYDEIGRLILMTQREFTSADDAALYAAGCNSAWRAFVVQRV